MVSIRVTVKLPKKEFSEKPYVNRLEKAMHDKAGRILKGLFEQTTEGWDHRVEFATRYSINIRSFGVTVYAYGENADLYRLVSNGSPPHTIRAKNVPLLHFRHGHGYTSATRPGTLLSRKKSSTGPWVTKVEVSHPGFEPREFPKIIRDVYEKEFADDMQQAITDAANE